MAKNFNQSLHFEDEIDPLELIRAIIESKMLLISITLIFTISATLYSLTLKPFFISSVTIEIGYFKKPGEAPKLFDNPASLIMKLREDLVIKNSIKGVFSQEVSMKPSGEALVTFKTKSMSIKANAEILNKYIDYIDKYHNELAVDNRMKLLEYNIDTYKKVLSNIKKSYSINTFLSEDIKFIYSTEADLKSQIVQLDLINQKDYKKTSHVGEIISETRKPLRELIAILGLLVGFFSGIFFIFIRNIFKNYKKVKTN